MGFCSWKMRYEPAPTIPLDAKSLRAGYEPAPTNDIIKNRTNLSEIIRQFKTFSARLINKMRNTPVMPIWQRNYYEHIIRNESELHKIREYIVNNPSNWQTDENYMK